MVDVIGVRFKKACKIYYFDPLDMQLQAGDGVIVETIKGIEYGDVVVGRKQVADEEVVKPLKPIIRKATQQDRVKLEENRQKEKKAFEICRDKIAKHKLDMKLICVEYTFDCSKIIFSFTAEGRVDFRELVKDLASVFKTRIELRQIGVRDETKMIGGLGPCGRPACCSVFLGDFQPVSIKMAKEQNLSLSPTKISGLCGRLMCCLNYEQAYYEELRTILPRVGAEVRTPDGRGTVMDTNAVRQLVKVKVELGEDETDVREYAVGDIKILRKNSRKPRTQEEQQIESAAPAADGRKPQKQGEEKPRGRNEGKPRSKGENKPKAKQRQRQEEERPQQT
jgi:cell fate regulator YaaT (PSP1 superfamily)